MASRDTKFEVICPECGERRFVGRNQNWQINSGKVSGICHKCANEKIRQQLKSLHGGGGAIPEDARFEVECPECHEIRLVCANQVRYINSGINTGLCRRCSYNRPEIKVIKSASIKKAHARPEVKERVILAAKKACSKPETIAKRGASIKRTRAIPEIAAKYRAATKISSNRPEVRAKISASGKIAQNSPEVVERRVGGFWYGNVRYTDGVVYCEKWKEVKPRIYAFNLWVHGDVLTCEKCGEPITIGETFSHHHVFYVKEVCCLINNDIYTTNLNIKSMPNDAYIIGPNPNYFAITHTSCHGKTNGGFENRKKWADFFKNKIDTEYGGKSYFTEEEMVEQGYIKITRTKWEK